MVPKLLLFKFVVLFMATKCAGQTCDRRPLGFTTDPLPPDNQYLIEIDDIREDKYIPNQEYTVRLKSRDARTTFIAFSISLQPASVANKDNPRRPILLKPGRLEPSTKYKNTKYSTTCNNTLTEADITPKNSVEVIWTAPDKDNQCVTIFAIVAVKPDVWYSFEGPLSKRVCEDRRKADDMQPMENDKCQVCDDARYQLTFEGRWSYNTHPYMYPVAQNLARFSDVVGASHSKEFILYKNNADASKGLKMLAEQGNTTELELEIQKYLGGTVRTVIKATAPLTPNHSTLTNFKVTREHHLVSLVTAMLPSPDWFLGVANLELCEALTKKWAEGVVLNLYPLDAGTDKGLNFEAPNEETSPPQPIASANLPAEIPKEEIKPFARLRFTLIRTYTNPSYDCIERTTTEGTNSRTDQENEVEGDSEGGEEGNEPEPSPESTSEDPASVNPTSAPDCPVSEWGEWLKCEGDGECVDNKAYGYQIRMRRYMGDVTDECYKDYPLSEIRTCTEECSDEEGDGTEAPSK